MTWGKPSRALEALDRPGAVLTAGAARARRTSRRTTRRRIRVGIRVGAAAASPGAGGAVDAARLAAADAEPQNWFTGGTRRQRDLLLAARRDQCGQRQGLGIRLGTTTWDSPARPGGDADRDRRPSCTPRAPGVYVYAVDAATGRELWRYDPKAGLPGGAQPLLRPRQPRRRGMEGQGVRRAVDGRLHAFDAATGKKIWDVDTITDHKLPYSSTGAPQIAGDGGRDRQRRLGHGARRGARLRSAYDLRPALSSGASTPCRRRPGSRSRIRSSPRPRKPGTGRAKAEVSGRRHGLGRLRL